MPRIDKARINPLPKATEMFRNHCSATLKQCECSSGFKTQRHLESCKQRLYQLPNLDGYHFWTFNYHCFTVCPCIGIRLTGSASDFNICFLVGYKLYKQVDTYFFEQNDKNSLQSPLLNKSLKWHYVLPPQNFNGQWQVGIV